ncbi:MAG: DsbA family protein [Patescibacteria group bacterium]|nr:DsbA family protein [Patescibacteria group bacterium]
MPEVKPWYKRTWGVVILIVAALILLGAGLFARQIVVFYGQIKAGNKPPDFTVRRFSGAQLALPPTTENRDEVKSQVAGDEGEPYGGAVSGTHQIVEFLDFDCPYSKSALPSVHDILRLRPDVKVIIRDFPLTDIHPDAEAEAIAARCVWRQGNASVYWKYHDLLFANQEKHDADSLKQFAYQAGVDSRYDSCVGAKPAAALVQRSVLDAINAGVSVTPTFFVDGIKVEGAADTQTLIKLLE